MKITDILSEQRKNPHLNPKIDPLKKLQAYKSEQDNIYVSYTAFDKIGINPGTSHNSTPIGIYTYHLKYVLATARHIEDEPYAGNAPYVWLIRPTKPVLVLQEYTQEDLESDIEKLRRALDPDEVNYARGMIPLSKTRSPGQIIWNLTKELSEYSVVKWNELLRKVLGYHIIRDNGDSIIHSFEPAQCVFLDRSCFEVVERIQKPEYANSQNVRDKGREKDKKIRKAVFVVKRYVDDFIASPSKQVIEELLVAINNVKDIFERFDLKTAIGPNIYNRLISAIQKTMPEMEKRFVALINYTSAGKSDILHPDNTPSSRENKW